MKLAYHLLPLFPLLLFSQSTLTHPIHNHGSGEVTIIGLNQSSRRQIGNITTTTVPSSDGAIAPELQLLADGNKAFRESLNKETPTLLKTLTDEGQAPPFMFIGCSDSRVSEGTVFNAKPGTFFTERNIANQFLNADTNTQTVLSYAVAELGVKHVIVMGHYGCGGVAAAIASPPTSSIDAANGVIQSWVEPIRELFRTSSRPEIVELRNKVQGQAVVEEPDISEPGFRALVEENVKVGVNRIAKYSVIANHYAALSSNTTNTPSSPEKRSGSSNPPGDVFIHGWVYDIESGEIKDLGISVGPPGKPVPSAPFEVVARAATAAVNPSNNSSSAKSQEGNPGATGDEGVKGAKKRCQQMCKAKRFFFGRESARERNPWIEA